MVNASVKGGGHYTLKIVRDENSLTHNESYGFQLFEDGIEKDSCWGFLGSFDEALQAIREYLPEEAAPLADSAGYGDDGQEYDIDDYTEMEGA